MSSYSARIPDAYFDANVYLFTSALGVTLTISARGSEVIDTLTLSPSGVRQLRLALQAYERRMKGGAR